MSHPEDWDGKKTCLLKYRFGFGSCELQPETVFFRDSDEPFLILIDWLIRT